MSDSVWPHRRQPTRLPRPWDSPSKNTGVGCHFLLQCMKVKSESEVAQSCPTLHDPMDYSLPGSSVHGIFQARVLEWGAIAFSESLVSQFYFIHWHVPDDGKTGFFSKPFYRIKCLYNVCLSRIIFERQSESQWRWKFRWGLQSLRYSQSTQNSEMSFSFVNVGPDFSILYEQLTALAIDILI